METKNLTKGYLDVPIDLSLDLFQEINNLKKEKNAIIKMLIYKILQTLLEIVWLYPRKQLKLPQKL